MLQDSSLGRYENALARDLPLACATIHSPDILILDEPTSGVDPVARDAFFDLLAGLSRNDKVTIFISTHFMNEGMSCGRISLMHAGEVLVYDPPENLAAESKSGTLNETFIHYINEATGEPTRAAEKPIAIQSGTTTRQQSASLTRLLAVSRREALAVMHDPIRLVFGFFGTMLLMLLFAYGISMDVTGLKFAAYDLDRTPESRAYLANFSGSTYFDEMPEMTGDTELQRRMVADEISLAIEIPAGFGHAVTAWRPTSVAAWIDGANTMRASTIGRYVQDAHRTFLSTRATNAGLAGMIHPKVNIEPRYRCNPGFDTLPIMVVAVPAILLLFPAILMAVSISREREIGTITNVYVTPLTKLEYLVGKQLPYIGIGFVNWIILTVMAVFLFGIPLMGSVLALALGAMTYVAAATGFGMMVALMPTIQFSGLFQPVFTLEGAGRIIGNLWPTTYFMQMSVGTFSNGLNFEQISPNILSITLFTPVCVAMAVLFMKKQEK